MGARGAGADLPSRDARAPAARRPAAPRRRQCSARALTPPRHPAVAAAQSRLLALGIAEELFKRSSKFRSSVALHYGKFLGLTIGHLEDWPLPPPAHAAASLREQALELIEQWSQAYGDLYPQLRMGYRWGGAAARARSLLPCGACTSCREQPPGPGRGRLSPPVGLTQGPAPRPSSHLCRYLKDSLKLEFPNIRSRRAEQERQQQELRERRQAHLRQRFAAASQEVEQQRASVEAALSQLEQLLQLASSEQQQQQQKSVQQSVQKSVHEKNAEARGEQQNVQDEQQRAGGAPAAGEALGASSAVAAADEDEEWEDIAAPATAEQPAVQQGLAAYAAEAADGPGGAPAGGGAAAAGPAAARLADAGVADALRDLVQQVEHSSMPSVQGWLRLLVALDMPADQQEGAQRQRLLRQAVELKARLQEALQRAQQLLGRPATGADAGRVEPGSPAAAAAQQGGRARAEQQRQRGVQELGQLLAGLPGQPHAAAAAEGGGARGLRVAPTLARRLASSGAAGSQPAAASRPSGRPPGRLASGRRPAAKDPYALIKDPAAPSGASSRYILSFNYSTGELLRPAAAPAAAGAGAAGQRPQAPAPSSRGAQQPAARAGSLPEHVKRALLAQAPVLPPSAELDWWSAPSANVLVDHRGLEISNHWGPVDRTAERPAHMLQQLLGLGGGLGSGRGGGGDDDDAAPAAEGGQPGGAGEGAPPGAATTCVGPQAAFVRRLKALKAQVAQQAGGATGAAPGASAAGSAPPVDAAVQAAAVPQGSALEPSTGQGGSKQQEQEQAQTQTAAAAADAAAAAPAAVLPGGTASRKRARELSRLHNLSVIAEAGDEAAAKKLQEALAAEARAASGEAGGKPRKQAKAAPSKADKLRKKLLG